jgi:hypothetical protein
MTEAMAAVVRRRQTPGARGSPRQVTDGRATQQARGDRSELVQEPDVPVRVVAGLPVARQVGVLVREVDRHADHVLDSERSPEVAIVDRRSRSVAADVRTAASDEEARRVVEGNHRMLATSRAGGPQGQVRHQLLPLEPGRPRIRDAHSSFAEAEHREIAWDERTRDCDQSPGRDLGRGRRGSVELAHRREQAGLTGDRPVLHARTIRRPRAAA